MGGLGRPARLASEARDLTIDAVHDGLLAVRRLVLERWQALPDIDARAVEALADETYGHHDEHRLDLERFPG